MPAQHDDAPVLENSSKAAAEGPNGPVDSDTGIAVGGALGTAAASLGAAVIATAPTVTTISGLSAGSALASLGGGVVGAVVAGPIGFGVGLTGTAAGLGVGVVTVSTAPAWAVPVVVGGASVAVASGVLAITRRAKKRQNEIPKVSPVP